MITKHHELSTFEIGSWYSCNNEARELCRCGLILSSDFVFQKCSTCVPIHTNLRAPTSNTSDWVIHHAYLIYGTQVVAKKFAETFKEFPSIQKPNSLTLDDALSKMSEAASGSH